MKGGQLTMEHVNNVMKRGNFMRKKCLMAVLAVILSFSVYGCGTSDEEVKKKVQSSKEKVKQEASEDGFSYKDVEGGICLIKYNGGGKDIVIPDELGGKSVVQLASGLFGDMDIASVEIPNSVKLIEGGFVKEDCEPVIKCNRSTAALEFSMYNGLKNELIGENEEQAETVDIYDSEGFISETLKLGDEGSTDVTKGISFTEENGESVLHLNGSKTGQIICEDFKSLTIELEEGSVNTISAAGGQDGLTCTANLVIRGNGSLSVTGGDYKSRGEGDKASVGSGIYVFGDLTIEDKATVGAKCGSSTYYSGIALLVNGGNLKVDNSSLELITPEGEGLAKSNAIIIYDINYDETYGKILLDNCAISEGGKVVKYQFENEDGSITTVGSTVGEQGDVCWPNEDVDEPSVPVSSHLKIQ